MLEKLIINNLVLMDTCEVDFVKNFNVITGETGAGKSILLSALSFLLGDKADFSLLRQGQEKAFCEAHFTITKDSTVRLILEDAGSDLSSDEEILIIRRELQGKGDLAKSRSFINNQVVHASILKKIAPYLIEFSSQHAHLTLLQPEAAVQLLDTYASINQEREAFQEAISVERKLKTRIETIQNTKDERSFKIEKLKEEIAEIESLKVEDGEEEELEEKLKKLSQNDELLTELQSLLTLFDSEKTSIVSYAQKISLSFDRVSRIDASFTSFTERFSSLVKELKELSFEMHRFQSSLDFDPNALEKVQKRIEVLFRMKKNMAHLMP